MDSLPERAAMTEEQPIAVQASTQPTGDERERARLAVLWLTAGLGALPCSVDPIDWHVWGLQAEVRVNGIPIGDVLTVYNHFRQDDFPAWLHARLAHAYTQGGNDQKRAA